MLYLITKRRIVLEKTTARFEENNVSFWKKQRIVLEKTTCRFGDNDSLFFIGYAEGKRTIGESEIDNAKMICKNTYNQQFSRVRVRAHITGVFVFLLSQVSQGICKWLYSRRLGISQTYFNRQKEEVPQIALESSAQIDLWFALLQDFIRLFS